MCMTCMAHRYQMRASDSMELQMVMKLPCGCWYLGPLQEQRVLVTAEHFFSPQFLSSVSLSPMDITVFYLVLDQSYEVK